jgi:diguanylate cyclase (GGDEF)-like protein
MPMNVNEVNGLLHSVVVTLHNKVLEEIVNTIRSEISYLNPPKEVQRLLDSTRPLIEHLQQYQPLESIPVELLSLLKRAVLDARLDLANRLDVSRARVSDPDTVEELNKQLAPYDEIMNQDWFNRTEALRVPQLTDFLTVERAERHLGGNEQQKRQYDEKFHILQAPTLFLPDLDYYRKKCGMRNVPVLVAFMDIDKFKDFNTAYGETYIDLYLLPRFMAALEAHVYARGFAYRFGGDEYAVLLPNTDTPMGAEILMGFQHKIDQIHYREIDQKTTVSIGFCEAQPDCHFTNRELLHFAEYAKNWAKQHGRNCVVTFSDSLYTMPYVLESR